jgi:hypothetical protein
MDLLLSRDKSLGDMLLTRPGQIAPVIVAILDRWGFVKFYAVETAAIAVFLVWLLTATVHEVRSLWNSEFPPAAHAAEQHDPCHVTLPLFRSD